MDSSGGRVKAEFPAGIAPDDGSGKQGLGQFAAPIKPKEYTDDREPGDWETRYPKEARRCINNEAWVLASVLVLQILLGAFCIGMSGSTWMVELPFSVITAAEISDPRPALLPIDFHLLAIFFSGAVGGTTFSIKWLIHTVAKCKWHLDRRYWRMFVPLIGGVYACVVLTLMDGGIFGAKTASVDNEIALTAALAFLIGYFSDGVSGLLSNVANAVFGTLEKR